jgi:hypothetical protein
MQKIQTRERRRYKSPDGVLPAQMGCGNVETLWNWAVGAQGGVDEAWCGYNEEQGRRRRRRGEEVMEKGERDSNPYAL